MKEVNALYGGSWREANDENKRHNFNVSYIYAPDSAWLAFAKLNLDYQKTDLAAVNYKGDRHWKTNEKELSEIF